MDECTSNWDAADDREILFCFSFHVILNQCKFIAGFHCHTIIKTIQQIKSRIKEIKEDEYSNSLTKVQVCENQEYTAIISRGCDFFVTAWKQPMTAHSFTRNITGI